MCTALLEGKFVSTSQNLQAYLRDIPGLVPDYNKANIALK